MAEINDQKAANADDQGAGSTIASKTTRVFAKREFAGRQGNED